MNRQMRNIGLGGTEKGFVDYFMVAHRIFYCSILGTTENEFFVVMRVG
jgi:hypothetical protein